MLEPSGSRHEAEGPEAEKQSPLVNASLAASSEGRVMKAPRDKNDITFGPGQEFALQDMQNPIMEWIMQDLGVQRIRVQHRNGWDHIHISFSGPQKYDLDAKIDAILDIAERANLLSERDKREFQSGFGRQIIKLIRSVQLDAEVSYTGHLTSAGDVEAKDLHGVRIDTGLMTITPSGGTIYKNATAKISGKMGFFPIPPLAHTIPLVFADAVVSSIKQFEAVRNRK